MTPPLIWVGTLLAALSIVGLRLAWRLPRRSRIANAACWLLLAAGLVCGAVAAGAWGVAVASLGAMGAAMLCLAHALLIAPPDRPRPIPRRTADRQGGSVREIARRTGTFLLVVPGALVAALAFCLGLSALFRLAGGSEANANALALFALPLVWMGLATLMLLTGRRGVQYAALAVPFTLGAAGLILAGGAA